MQTRKVNIGVAPTFNFDKVTLEIIDEPIEFENEAQFKEKVAAIFDTLNDLVSDEFTKIQEGK